MIEMVEAACAVPTTMQGRIARGRLAQRRRRDDAPAGRRLRRDRAVQLPRDGPFWFLPFAIACGNTFILKPSEQAPLTQQIAFEVLDGPACRRRRQPRQGRPRGGRGHPRAPGHRRRVVRRLGAGRADRLRARGRDGKRVQALGGAKNHMVVMPDAVIDKTVDGIIGSAFGAAGQRCMAGSVVVTVGDAYEQLLRAAARATEAVRVCDGLDGRPRSGRWCRRGARAHPRLDRPRNRRRCNARRSTAASRSPVRRLVRGPNDPRGVTPEMADRAGGDLRPGALVVHVDTLDEAIALSTSAGSATAPRFSPRTARPSGATATTSRRA